LFTWVSKDRRLNCCSRERFMGSFIDWLLGENNRSINPVGKPERID
jgi:hypothetical protein